jgi:hypothetical protein
LPYESGKGDGMSESSSGGGRGGIGFVGLLTIVFITLKLCGVINWSWWWVLSPLWITAILVAALLVLALIGYLFYTWGRP